MTRSSRGKKERLLLGIDISSKTLYAEWETSLMLSRNGNCNGTSIVRVNSPALSLPVVSNLVLQGGDGATYWIRCLVMIISPHSNALAGHGTAVQHSGYSIRMSSVVGGKVLHLLGYGAQEKVGFTETYLACYTNLPRSWIRQNDSHVCVLYFG